MSVTLVLMLRSWVSTIVPSGAQLESLYLPRRGLRQLGKKLYPARVFVGGELVLHVLLERGLQHVVPARTRLEHDECLGLDEPVLVFGADHRGLEHRLVSDERRLDLRRRHVDSRYLQHVVGAPSVYVVPVLVLPVLVAALGPAAVERAAAFLAVVPVVGRARGSAD